MTEPKPGEIHVLVLPEQSHWVAQCLEYDIAVQARSMAALRQAFSDLILGHIHLAETRGQRPFEGVKRAPAWYWEQYEAASPIADFEINFPQPKTLYPERPWSREAELLKCGYPKVAHFVMS